MVPQQQLLVPVELQDGRRLGKYWTMVLDQQHWWDEGRRFRGFSGTLFQGIKTDDHVIFKVSTLLYFFLP